MSFTSLLKSILDDNQMPVTFGMTEWYENGQPVTEAAAARVIEVLKADTTTGRGGQGRIRPSLIGDTCERKHILSFLGAETEPHSQKSLEYMNAGTWGHYRWQIAGLSAGWLKDIEVKVSHAPWFMAGSMDGLLSDGSGFELKTTGSFMFSKILKSGAPKREHLMQVHAYMKALGIDTFSIVYENRDSLDWQEYRVTMQPEIMDALESMMENLVQSIGDEELPPMLGVCSELKGKTYENCSWRLSCPVAQWTVSRQ